MTKVCNYLAVFAAATLFCGCATVTEQHHSEAYRIASAGGLSKDIRDTVVPAGKIGSIEESVAKVGFVAAGYIDPQLGMTSWQSMGANVLAEMLEPDSHGARISMMAWMPESLAVNRAQARDAFVIALTDATKNALASLDVTYEVLTMNRDGVTSIQIIDENWNCPEYKTGKTKLSDTCRIRIHAYEPAAISAPPDFMVGSERRYPFTSGHGRKYQKLDLLVTDSSRVPGTLLYESISKFSPEWLFIYVAPGKLMDTEGTTVPFPYILNRGQAKLFLKPSEID